MAGPIVESFGDIFDAYQDTIVLDAPSGIEIGDLLLAFIGIGSNRTLSTPVGWTLEAWADGADTVQPYIYSRVAEFADTEATNYTWTVSTNGDGTGRMARISGHDGVVDADDNAGVSSETCDAPSVTPTAAETLVFHQGVDRSPAIFTSVFGDDTTTLLDMTSYDHRVTYGEYGSGPTGVQSATVDEFMSWGACSIGVAPAGASPSGTILPQITSAYLRTNA